MTIALITDKLYSELETLDKDTLIKVMLYALDLMQGYNGQEIEEVIRDAISDLIL